MSQQFVKGYTNNHLTWVMVDATDFATPESALSAATKIKIYGKVKGATGVNFVSSGTGSLTNDIQHVGASALGIYTIALAKADLSDASAAWYDQYIISLSATGAAYQAIVVDGGIWISDLSAIASDIRSDVSDMHSDLIVMSGILSDAYSMLAAQSNAISAFQSDFQSRVPKRVATDSQLSALHSDLDSAIVSATSDIKSAVAAGPAATITASDISDIVSAVWAAKWDIHSVASSFGSMFEVMASSISDIRSNVSDLQSDFQSRVPKLVANNSQLSALHSDIDSALVSLTSDLKSAIAAGPAATVTASDISDIASAVWAAKYFGAAAHNVASSFGSMLRVRSSDISDIDSMLTAMSDILSNVNSLAVLIQVDTSNIASRVTGAVATASDVASKVWAEKYTAASNVKASTFGSLLRINMSRLSDTYSMLSDLQSDFQSRVPKAVATNSQLSALHSDLDSTIVSQASDLKSAIAAGGGTVTVSNISDIASAVWAEKYTAASNVKASSFGSLARLNMSRLSDTYSMLSDLQSDFQSRVPKLVATNSQVSDVVSDLRSVVVGNSGILSDIYSLLSDVSSDIGVMSGIQSDIASVVLTAGFKKNTALSAFEFLMVDSADHITPKTGLTVTATRSIDGGAFGAATNSGTIAEVGNGIYSIDLSTTDMNGAVVTLRFTATGADDRYVTIKTHL